VHHIADIGLVDAHAERDGGDDAVQFTCHEAPLDRFTQLVRHARVVGAGRKAPLRQVFSDLLGGLLLGDVDDGRLPRPVRQPFHQPALLVEAADRLHQQIEIGSVETGGHHVIRRNREFGLHVGDHRGRRRGSQQQRLGNVELALVVGELQIVRAKVVAPLGDAVRLVHHQQGDRHLADEVAEALVLQPFHRDHQDLQLAGLGAGHGLARLLAALRRVDAGGGNAMAVKERQLVLHQRQQG